MAKVAFSKLGLKPVNTVTNIHINDLVVEVKNYLSVNEKLTAIGNVINNSIDDNGYYNEGKVRVYFVLEMVDAYTNISFTEKQQEDPCKLYDLIVGNGLWYAVWDVIPQGEKEYLETCLNKTIKSIYDYKNSVLGLLDTVSKDYNNMDLDATQIQQKLADPNSLELLKEVLTKLG